MIDLTKERAECARMQAACDEKAPPEWKAKLLGEAIWNCAFADRARTGWPALIKSHLEACAEIERLREANSAYLESHLRALELAKEREQEIERLRKAGLQLAATGSPQIFPEAWDAACKEFEEGE